MEEDESSHHIFLLDFLIAATETCMNVLCCCFLCSRGGGREEDDQMPLVRGGALSSDPDSPEPPHSRPHRYITPGASSAPGTVALHPPRGAASLPQGMAPRPQPQGDPEHYKVRASLLFYFFLFNDEWSFFFLSFCFFSVMIT
jgi:hypothetical protein